MPRRSTLRRPPILALLTDFGLSDPFVGIMKGVILQRLPQARLIDLTHAIEPGNIRHAAFALWTSDAFLPERSVVVAVVDPGVGTGRPVAIMSSRHRTYIGPENGIFDLVRSDDPRATTYRATASAISRWSLKDASTTFHGRDIFAPLAAALASGVSPATLGKRVHGPPVGPWRASAARPSVRAEIMSIDRFGNLVTNIELPAGRPIHASVRMVSVGKIMVSKAIETYDEAPENTPCLIRGSSGLLEVVVRGRSASLLLGAHDGTPIQAVWA